MPRDNNQLSCPSNTENTMTLTETLTMVKHNEYGENTLKDWGLSPGGSPALATAEEQ